MKKPISIAITMLALVTFMYAREKPNPTTVTPELVQKAAQFVPALRSMMKDPDSFVLEGVSVDKYEDKKHPDSPGFCFDFRAHNSYGGYGDIGHAWTDHKGTIRVFDNTSGGEQIAEAIICGPKSHTDITNEVKAALAPPPPPVVSPADAAAKAQQYADCLKAAVNNPSIACKP
jgi:hypothetical protein